MSSPFFSAALTASPAPSTRHFTGQWSNVPEAVAVTVRPRSALGLKDVELTRGTSYEGFADGVSLETLRLEPLDGGRCRLTATSLVDSFEGRDAFVASGMEQGVREGYERLDELLAGEPTVSTYHAYAGRLVGEHALRLPAEPAAREKGVAGEIVEFEGLLHIGRIESAQVLHLPLGGAGRPGAVHVEA